ncbi:MAG: JmjC domain-containing protein [Cyclobacteriaceae bacterium]|jgi:ribosomal protein L16 Arg81 hydroxylase
METLKTILKGFDLNAFFKDHWTRNVLHVKGNSSDYNRLFNWEEFNSVVNYRDLAPHIKFSLNGKVLSPKELTSKLTRNGSLSLDDTIILDLVHRGSTVILQAIHKIHPHLNTFVNNLSDEFGESVEINAYCSYPGKRGFDKHTDAHEVFILQVEGSKQWEIYDIENIFPIENQLGSSIENKEYNCKIYKLEKGDVLYVPRGVWHSAFADNTTSLHLTVSIRCRTKLFVLNHLYSHLLENINIRKNLNSSIEAKTFSGYKKEDIKDALEQLRQITEGYLLDIDSFTNDYNKKCTAAKATKVLLKFPYDQIQKDEF